MYVMGSAALTLARALARGAPRYCERNELGPAALAPAEAGGAEVLVGLEERDRPEPVDDGLDPVGLAGVGGVRAAEGGDVAGGAGERRQVAAGRVAPERDAAAVEPVLAGVGAQPADGGLDVVDRRWEVGLLAQPVVDADHGVAALEGLQDRPDLTVGLVAADEPAPVDADDDRVRRLALRGQVQIQLLRRRGGPVGKVLVHGAGGRGAGRGARAGRRAAARRCPAGSGQARDQQEKGYGSVVRRRDERAMRR